MGSDLIVYVDYDHGRERLKISFKIPLCFWNRDSNPLFFSTINQIAYAFRPSSLACQVMK